MAVAVATFHTPTPPTQAVWSDRDLLALMIAAAGALLLTGADWVASQVLGIDTVSLLDAAAVGAYGWLLYRIGKGPPTA